LTKCHSQIRRCTQPWIRAARGHNVNDAASDSDEHGDDVFEVKRNKRENKSGS
jgi:hypothetical protein